MTAAKFKFVSRMECRAARGGIAPTRSEVARLCVLVREQADAIRTACDEARAEEREACARIADSAKKNAHDDFKRDYDAGLCMLTAANIAEMIRARGRAATKEAK